MKQVLYTILTILAALVGGDQNEEDLKTVIVGDPTTYRSNYEQSGAAKRYHSVPRFGHSSNFTSLLSSDQEDRIDYFLGTVFRGASTLTFFLVWGILILNFKCLGSKKVGKLLAGDGQRTKNRVSTASVAFFICALLVIVFAFLLVEKGLSEMQNSITAVGYNDEIATHQNEFLTLSEDLKSMVNRAMSNFNELNRIFGHSMCPPNIDPTIQNGMIQIIDGILEVLKNANHVEDSKLTVLDDLIGMLNKTTAEMNGSLQQIQLSDFHVLGLLIPLLLLPLYFVGSILLRWTRYDIGNLQKAHYFFLWWIVLPLFVVTILFTIAATSSVTVGAIANADFCSGGPNKTPEVNVHALLDTNEATRSGLPNDIASFYVDQCTSNDTPFGFLEDYAHVLAQSQVDINNLITALKDDESSQIAHECGTSFAVPISTAESLVTTLASIKEMVYDISDKFSCPVIVPFYIKLVHKDICVGTMEAFGWTYTSLFLISFFGMFVITLRATCWEWDLKDWQEADELSQPFKIDQSYSTVATDADMKSNLSSRI